MSLFVILFSNYSTRIVTSEMIELVGKITVIERYYGNGNPGYRIKGSDCYWDGGMFDVIDIPSLNITVFIGKYDKNYIALVDGVFDEKIYSSLNEIKKIYKLHKIKLLFQDE